MGAEFLTIFWRDMIKFFRMKVMLIANLIQPVLWLAFFGLAMSGNFDDNISAPAVAGDTVQISYLTFMSAGIIAMTILFTCLNSGMFLQLDRQYGLLKEMIASPMPRSHILVGLSLSGVAKSLLQVLLIIVFGVLLGVELFAGFAMGEVLIALIGTVLFVVLFSLGLMSLSNIIALKIESHEGVSGVITMLTLPLFFTSNALYPLDSLPSGLREMAYINPMTHFINGIRYFTIGPDFSAMGNEYSFGTGDMLISLTYLIGFNIIMYLLSARVIKNAKVT